MITVTNLSPRRVCRQRCSSTPMTFTPSNRVGSLISTRRPSARTASLAVSHDTARASAMRATVKCGTQELPAPTATRGETTWLAARRPSSCPAATHARSQCTGSGAPSPAASWVATRTARARLAGHAVPRRSFAAAAATPPVVLGDAAGQHRTFRFQALPDHDQAEFVEAAERSQVGAREGSSVKHVEVSRVAGVGTSILGRPRPLQRHGRAGRYTLKSEEPEKPQASDLDAGWVDFRKPHRHIIATNSANRNSDSGSYAADDSLDFGQRTVPQCECIGSGEHPGYRSLGVPW